MILGRWAGCYGVLIRKQSLAYVAAHSHVLSICLDNQKSDNCSKQLILIVLKEAVITRAISLCAATIRLLGKFVLGSELVEGRLGLLIPIYNLEVVVL